MSLETYIQEHELHTPFSKRDAPAHGQETFRHFVGLRANELATKTLIKLDEAGELEQAAHQVGFIPETSLPNRWPHNALLERDIRGGEGVL